MEKRSRRTLAVCLLGLVPTLGCSKSTPSPKDSINVIAVLPFTGTFAAKGVEHEGAIRMAIRDIEAAGSIRGKHVLLHPVDGNDPTGAALDQEIASLRGQGAEIAGIISSTTGAFQVAAPRSLALGLPLIEVSSGSDLMEIDGTDPNLQNADFVFATRPLCQPEPTETAQWVVAANAATGIFESIAFMRGPMAHDQMHTTLFRNELLAKGYAGKIVGMGQNNDDIVIPKGSSPDAFIEQVMAIQPMPDTIYYHLNGDSTNQAFFLAAKRVGWPGRIITCGMAESTTLFDPSLDVADYLSGQAVNGVPALPDGRLFFAMRGFSSSPARDAFFQAFGAFAASGISPTSGDVFSPSAYDAAMLLLLAVASTPAEASSAAVRDAVATVTRGQNAVAYPDVADALKAASAGVSIAYSGPTTNLQFTLDSTDGYLVPGRYYVDRIQPSSSGYAFVAVAQAPDEVLAPGVDAHH